LKKTIIRSGLETLYFSGTHHWMRPLVGGVGAILTLHHVRPQRPDAFQPNRHLEVTPEFLERLLRRLARARIDVISLNEMHRRFIEDDFVAATPNQMRAAALVRKLAPEYRISPALALAHLARLLADQPQSPKLAAGEIITTGTVTDAWPVAAGEVWSSDYGALGINGLALSFEKPLSR
jgi:hypothetical protein